MSQVWEACDERFGRQVAVKLLPADVDDELEAPVRRFLREISVTGSLSHPGIPAVHDTGRHNDSLFLVMELVPGRTLGDLLAEQGTLPVPWAASISAQIASVLEAAHGDGLIHRDLKPANIMINDSGAVKVLDFGLVALQDELSEITGTGEIVGTLSYISPEQLRDESTTPRTDLYALGCVLHEMLTGSPPFKGQAGVLIEQHFTHVPDRLVRPDVPPELADLVEGLLRKNPADRPASAAEVYHRLATHIVGAAPLGDIEPDGNLYARALARLT